MATSVQKTNTSLVEGKTALLSEEITIFLFDCSSSMLDRIKDDGTFDLGNYEMCTKFGALKHAAKEYVSQRIRAVRNGSNDRVGIILFGEEVKLMHDPASVNFENLLKKVERMRCSGGTPMAKAVNLAIETAERFSSGMIRVVICSDGQPDYAHSVYDNVIRGFEEYGIIFDTVGIGEGYGVAEEFLKRVADLGGGEYTLISSFQEFTKKFLLIEGERQLLLGKGILMLPGK